VGRDPAGPEATTPVRTEPMRVLVVEDNPKLAAVLKSGLAEQGYDVEVTGEGFEGEELGAEGAFDLIVLDRMLPDRDGIEVCRNLRRREVGVPILMLTALSSTENRVAGLDAGADDYLPKPFEFDEFLARVRALLRRGQAQESTLLRHEDVELDLVGRKVTRAGDPIDVSAKEFALLEYFVRNAERVLPRTQILERVWGLNYEPTSNVLDVYISNLRKKLDKLYDSALIHTVIGVGYRFGKASPGAAEGGR